MKSLEQERELRKESRPLQNAAAPRPIATRMEANDNVQAMAARPPTARMTQRASFVFRH